MTERIAFALNGVRVEVRSDPMRRLSDVLIKDLGLTSMNASCAGGDCGGCTVIVDGRRQAACRLAVAMVDGSEVSTVEG
jgi:aerobic-type carbon monoxide dehydrogenase small subunit (CoxS/CutS family)